MRIAAGRKVGTKTTIIAKLDRKVKMLDSVLRTESPKAPDQNVRTDEEKITQITRTIDRSEICNKSVENSSKRGDIEEPYRCSTKTEQHRSEKLP